MRQFPEITYQTPAYSITFIKTDKDLNPVSLTDHPTIKGWDIVSMTFVNQLLFDAFKIFVNKTTYTFSPHVSAGSILVESIDEETLSVKFNYEQLLCPARQHDYLVGKFLLELGLDWPKEYIEHYKDCYLSEYKMITVAVDPRKDSGKYFRGATNYYIDSSRYDEVSIPEVSLRSLQQMGFEYKQSNKSTLIQSDSDTAIISSTRNSFFSHSDDEENFMLIEIPLLNPKTLEPIITIIDRNLSIYLQAKQEPSGTRDKGRDKVLAMRQILQDYRNNKKVDFNMLIVILDAYCRSETNELFANKGTIATCIKQGVGGSESLLHDTANNIACAQKFDLLQYQKAFLGKLKNVSVYDIYNISLLNFPFNEFPVERFDNSQSGEKCCIQ